MWVYLLSSFVLVASTNGANLSALHLASGKSSTGTRVFSIKKSEIPQGRFKVQGFQNNNVTGTPINYDSAPESVIVQSKTGHGVKLDLIDHEFSKKIIKNVNDEPKTNKLIAAYLSGKMTGDLIVDAGASVGDTTLWLEKCYVQSLSSFEYIRFTSQ